MTNKPTLGSLRSASATGFVRNIISTLESLQENPDDPRLLDSVADMAFADSATFVATVLDHYTLPTFPIVPPAAFERLPCGSRKTWSNYVGTQFAQPFEIA